MQKLILTNLNRKIISLIFLLLFGSSCDIGDKPKTITEEIFYKITYKESNQIDFSIRTYKFINDTIKLRTRKYNSLGEPLPSFGENGIFIIKGECVYLVNKGKNNSDFHNIIYDIRIKDSCWVYDHPYFNELKNCYKGTNSKRSELIFSSEQTGYDGIRRILFLDRKYILIKEISDTPLEKFKEMIKVDKSEIPKSVLKSMNNQK